MSNVVSIDDAVDGVLQKAFNFNESIDVAVRVSHGDPVRGYCDLPTPFSGVGVMIFAPFSCSAFLPENLRSLVGAEDLIESISAKKSVVKGYKCSIAVPALMPKIGKIARILGPRGLMPDAKFGLVTEDIESVVKAISRGRVFFKTNKGGIIHAKVGNRDLDKKSIKENFSSFIASVKDLKPKSVSWSDYIASVSLSSTMGSGFSVDCSVL